MLPVQIRGLFRRVTRQLLLEAPVLPLVVVTLHPEQRQRGRDQDGAPGSEVEAVSDVVVWRIPAEEAPRGDEATDIAKHDCSENVSAHDCKSGQGGCPNRAYKLKGEGAGLPFVPIAALRAVSLTTFALTCAFVRAPSMKADAVIMKVAP